MRLFFTKKELKLRKKRVIMMIACMTVLLAGYLILTWPKKIQPELPTVIVEPAEVGDVEIFGEYVGRIRAQQFVEVRARVEGYLESMLFAEGTYITKNQVLFVINQDQYRAKADKARAQLKKDEAQALKAKRDLERIRPLYAQNAASQLDLDNAQAAYETAEASVAMSQADLDQAELELGYTIVRSPLSGHISERNVDLGTLVGPGAKSLLATIVKSDTVLVEDGPDRGRLDKSGLDRNGLVRSGLSGYNPGANAFLTDNGNYILDLLGKEGMDYRLMAGKLKALTGVVETGLFGNICEKIIVGTKDGVMVKSPEKP